MEPKRSWRDGNLKNILSCHNENPRGLTHLVKWKHQRPSWQLEGDLKGQEKVLLDFHAAHPNKPGPPAWVKKSLPPPPINAPAPERRRSDRLRLFMGSGACLLHQLFM